RPNNPATKKKILNHAQPTPPPGPFTYNKIKKFAGKKKSPTNKNQEKSKHQKNLPILQHKIRFIPPDPNQHAEKLERIQLP
ncbi:hypothetical protein ACQWF0_25430, partial [Salmonella enterica subsp. enterica serovar Infantis]